MKLQSLDDMQNFGIALAGALEPGTVLLLKGELGVGKTELARAVIRAWMGDTNLDVPSPSFTLVQSYQRGGVTLNHFDLYRLSAPDELIELGVPEIFEDQISLIEWPERLGSFRPEHALEIEILDLGGTARQIVMEHAIA